MSSAVKRFFDRIIGGIKTPTPKPVVKDEEVLGLMARGKKKKPIKLEPFSTKDETRMQVLESQAKVSDAFSPEANPKMKRLREADKLLREGQATDDVLEAAGYDRRAYEEARHEAAMAFETGEIDTALIDLEEGFGHVKLESNAYKKLADFYSPLAVAINDIKFPKKGLSLKQIKEKLANEYNIPTGQDTEFDKIFSVTDLDRFDKDAAQDLINRNAIRLEAVYIDETDPVKLMNKGVEVINDRVNTLAKNNVFDPQIADIDSREGFAQAFSRASDYQKYQRPGVYLDNYFRLRSKYLKIVEAYNSSAVIKGLDHPNTVALKKKMDTYGFDRHDGTPLYDFKKGPTYATIRLRLVPHKGFEELVNLYDKRLLDVLADGNQHYTADTLAHARIDIVDETRIVPETLSKFPSKQGSNFQESAYLNTFSEWRKKNPNSKLNTKYVYLTEGQSDLLQSFMLDNETLLKAFKDDKETLRYHKALMKQSILNVPVKRKITRDTLDDQGFKESDFTDQNNYLGYPEFNRKISEDKDFLKSGSIPKPKLYPLPAESMTAVMKQLLQATIAYAHKNNIKQIVIPSVEQIASLRDKSIFRVPFDSRVKMGMNVRDPNESIERYHKKVTQGLFFQTYDTAIKNALKKLKKDGLITTFETPTPVYSPVIPKDLSISSQRIDLKKIDKQISIKELMKLDELRLEVFRGKQRYDELDKFYNKRKKGIGKYNEALDNFMKVADNQRSSEEITRKTDLIPADPIYINKTLNTNIENLEKKLRNYIDLIAELSPRLRNEFFDDDFVTKNIKDNRLPPDIMQSNNKDFTDAWINVIKYGTYSPSQYQTFPLKQTHTRLQLLAFRASKYETESLFTSPNDVMLKLIKLVENERQVLRESTQAKRIAEQNALVIDISKLSEKLGKQDFVLEFSKGGLVVGNLQKKGLMSRSTSVAA
tara:strand:- start:1135 stop:3942 length:2808 start_codon:yes stop_codon:yes gene_type:complete